MSSSSYPPPGGQYPSPQQQQQQQQPGQYQPQQPPPPQPQQFYQQQQAPPPLSSPSYAPPANPPMQQSPPPPPHFASPQQAYAPPGPQQQPSYPPQPLPPSHQSYQLTHAQLSPAMATTPPPPTTTTTIHASPSFGADPPQPQLPARSSSSFGKSKGLTGTITSLFSSKDDTTTNNNHGPPRNLGFQPTPAMIARHEKLVTSTQLSPEARAGATRPPSPRPRPLYQFQVTKLRSWRAGYIRLLALYEADFVTLDPHSAGDAPNETNRWKYTSLTEWLALPKERDNILLQVDQDKLKFTCHNVPRALVLTALLQCQDESGQAPANETIVFERVERITRHGTSVNVSLHVKAYGLVEVHPHTKERLQTYRYVDIATCSFTSGHEAGLVITMKATQPHKSRLYLVHSSRKGGNGRSDILTLMREAAEVLGLNLPMEESMTVPAWIQRRQQGSATTMGTVATAWTVTKTTKRHDVKWVGPNNNMHTNSGGGGGAWVGGSLTRELAFTANGWIVEREHQSQSGGGGGGGGNSNVVSCRRMRDLVAIVRPPLQGDQIILEFANGSYRTYSMSSSRDALIVSLLDAAATYGKNTAVYVTDVSSAGYCLASMQTLMDDPEYHLPPESGGPAASLFQPISIPIYCLKRVHALATQAYAFVSRDLDVLLSQPSPPSETALRPPIPVPQSPLELVLHCDPLVETCREFNASVLPTGEGLPTGAHDKHISGSIGALWGLVAKLLRSKGFSSQADTPVHQNARESSLVEQTATTFLQTLYRLSRTLAGYKVSAELTTFQECIPELATIQDSLCKFWAFSVLNVLLSGLPQRDLEAEFVNKSVVLRTAGRDFVVHGLVGALLPEESAIRQDSVSDLVLMVASDILQSLLCSYHDTTAAEHFGVIIAALAERYVTDRPKL